MNNFISILTKNNKSNYVKNLRSHLSDYYETKIISDEETYSDQYSIKKEFYGLAKFTYCGPMPKITCSWDKSFLSIYENNLKYDYFYFIEDDVYCENLKIFKNLIKTLNKFDEDLVSSYVRNKNENLGVSEVILMCNDRSDEEFNIPNYKIFNLNLDTYNKPLLCNFGVDKAKFDVVALLDSDRILPIRYFENKAKILRKKQFASSLILHDYIRFILDCITI